ncbi:MAG: SulP family inorganic anion transporter, partial [Clostridia bacterium]|nr:SulP family inorganic anion transporter [Clostridia bacterium]
QGIGNIVIPFFGGVPATAAIARTSVAIKSGARTRVCGIVHAFGLLASMFLLGGVMAKLPLAALAGVLLVTAWRMNEWSEIRYIVSHRFFGAIAKFLLTMVATIVFDLTVAILLGIGFSMLLFVIRSAKLRVELSDVDEDGDSHPDYVIAYISGPIFFADLGGLMSKLEKARGDCPHLILSFRGVPSVDTSGVEEILECLEAFDKEGVKVSICGMNESVRKMLERGGLAASEKLVIETSLDKILTKG